MPSKEQDWTSPPLLVGFAVGTAVATNDSAVGDAEVPPVGTAVEDAVGDAEGPTPTPTGADDGAADGTPRGAALLGTRDVGADVSRFSALGRAEGIRVGSRVSLSPEGTVEGTTEGAPVHGGRVGRDVCPHTPAVHCRPEGVLSWSMTEQ